MELTDIQKVKLEVGLQGDATDLLFDEEIQYFLTKNKGNIRKASLDAAKTVLFILSQRVHERSGTELEIWGHTWYENYMRTLKLYLTDPNYNIALEMAKAYGGGVSVADIQANVAEADNNTVQVDAGIPTDGDAIGSSNNPKRVFDREYCLYPKTPFSM